MLTMDYMKEFKSVAEKFAISGNVLSIEPYGEGHINLTLLVTTDEKRYIMQKMNTNVFPDTEGLMANICGVTEYLRNKKVETLCVIPTICGKSYYSDESGSFEYELVLRPWGTLWDDVPAEDLKAKPYFYEDWYLPLVEAGETMPSAIDHSE